jgi:hypothetical protein
MTDDMDDRVKRVEYQLWGLNGTNGLVSEVRGLRTDMNRWREAEERKDAAAKIERKQDVRWRIGTAIAIVMAILAAATIVASSI